MKKIIKVEGMSCNNCSKAVTNRLMEIDGISSVDVDLGSKEVKINGTDIKDDQINQAIDEIGFEVV